MEKYRIEQKKQKNNEPADANLAAAVTDRDKLEIVLVSEGKWVSEGKGCGWGPTLKGLLSLAKMKIDIF